MARLIGPSEGSRKVETIVASAGVTKGLFKSKAGRPAQFFTDAAATQVADILLDSTGLPVADGTVTIDAYSMLPLIRFPDGVDTLYVIVDGGPAWPVYAREDDQIDALETAVAALQAGAGAAETPAGAQAKVDAHAADTTGVHGIADTAALETTTGAQTKASAAQSAAISTAATDATTKANAAQSAAISAAATDATTKANAAQAAAVQRGNHTGTQSADTVVDGTTNKAFTAANQTKLAGIAPGATANSTDAQLRDRTTHTGTQALSTITGMTELFVAGSGIDPTGVADSTTAIQALFTQAGTNSITTFGQRVRFPAGRFKISATLLSDLARGVEIVGAGRSSTYLIATSALAGQPVIRMQDYYHCAIRDMTIQGTGGSQPYAGIDSHRERNNGVVPAQINQKLHVENVEFVTVERGISWTLSGAGADGNNDQSTVSNCYVHAFTVAAYDINGVNPVWIRFIGGEIAAGPIAWRLAGGSFNAFGVVLGALTDVEVDVTPGNYIHATTLTGVSSEIDASGGKILRTSAVSGFNIMYTGYERTQSVANKTMIDFQATGFSSFNMVNSFTNFGQLGQLAQFTDSTSTARFIGCPGLAFNEISYNGRLYLFDNRHIPGTVTLTNLGSGTLFQQGDAGGGFTPAAVVPTTRTISTTAPVTGGGDLSANRTIAVSDATTGAKGVVQLAGDLAGTAASPALAANSVTQAKLATSLLSDVQELTATGSWNKPAGAKTAEVLLIPSSGGGGSGRRGASGSVCGGGGAGAAGQISRRTFDAADLPSTVTVTINPAGAGGAAVTTNDTNGNPGGNGGTVAFGVYLAAEGGRGGAGGTTTGGAGGANFIRSSATTGGAGAPGGTGAVGGTADASNVGPGGGGGGGGISATPAAFNGGPGGGTFLGRSAGGGIGGIVDTTPPTAGTASDGKGTPGGAPGGGAASITTAAQPGADAINYGAGGGGGGASLNGNNSGAGGAGKAGYALIITRFV